MVEIILGIIIIIIAVIITMISSLIDNIDTRNNTCSDTAIISHKEINDCNVPFHNNAFISKGWECPKCGRVYSPTTPMCFYCMNKK